MIDLLDGRIHVAIRSYKRAGQVTTLDLVPYSYVWCPVSQEEDYRRHYGDRVIAIPDSEDGNSARKANAILNRAPADWVLILDDDITRIGYYEGGQKYAVAPPMVAEMISHYFPLAAAMGVHLWGINQTSDSLHYRGYTPFSLLSPILGPFMGIIRTNLRFDPLLWLKEDYDFWLQHIERDRRTFRVNKFHYMHDHGKKSGGVADQRTMQEEARQFAIFQRKWGEGIVQRQGGSQGGKSATGQNVMNTIVKVPIPGI